MEKIKINSSFLEIDIVYKIEDIDGNLFGAVKVANIKTNNYMYAKKSINNDYWEIASTKMYSNINIIKSEIKKLGIIEKEMKE